MILTFLEINNIIYAFLVVYIVIVNKKVMCIIKISMFLSNATFANFFLLMISTFLMINRALAVV